MVKDGNGSWVLCTKLEASASSGRAGPCFWSFCCWILILGVSGFLFLGVLVSDVLVPGVFVAGRFVPGRYRYWEL